ncbi:Myb-like DNA-binding domain containing protein [Tritrichomonas foetus]|uniref:Myb-like DNA-binding domain containing protein n=1 Tax=Tritrichomonas foetus TaxID=1144522 RepID=A0A1J4KU80_9EUKA|nr:Myb-like DNA-binding domain containing protein [Tritrichomonas foetus]|eukprot:OHT14823.1 Myb-like DNA-binding domain containing protein [Tritrichomonas foetus]
MISAYNNFTEVLDEQQSVVSPAQSTSKRNYKPHAKFTIDDDETLKNLVIELGENWNEIANRMPGRNPRQVRERYQNYLSPSLNTSRWTIEEDTLLVQKVQEIGQKWVKISRFFPNRTDQMMKNRYNVLKRKQMKKMASIENSSVSSSTDSSSESNVSSPEPSNNFYAPQISHNMSQQYIPQQIAQQAQTQQQYIPQQFVPQQINISINVQQPQIVEQNVQQISNAFDPFIDAPISIEDIPVFDVEFEGTEFLYEENENEFDSLFFGLN